MLNETGNKTDKGRILSITSNFPRWKNDSTTPFVLNLAEDLVKEGWIIDVLAPHAPNSLKYEKFNKVPVHRFQYSWPKSTQTVCYQGGALVNLRKNPLNKLKLPLLVIAEFFAMMRLLLKNKYDVIHAHWILPQGLNAVLLGKLFNIPVVVTVHGGDIFGLRGSIMTWLKKKVLNAADTVTVNSNFTGNAVRELTTNIKDLKKIPMGVSVAPFNKEDLIEVESLKNKFRKDDGPLLVFAGRLVEEKGISDLLNAIALIAKKQPAVTAIIAGEGQDRELFEQQCRELNINDKVSFLGWIPNNKVPIYMAASDFFVGPSRTSTDGWVEAQGLTFLEAMAVGSTVIATSSGGIKESIIHEETGFLVDENNPEQIADCVLKVHHHPENLKYIKKNAYQHVINYFSRDFSARQFDSIFNKLKPEISN